MHQVQLESAQSATRKKIIPFILNEQLVNAIEFKSEELWFFFAFEKDKIQNWLQP